ncbi:MAG: 4Fe-4S dicluster domain-containing protein [Alphaproteobacteria bacterium]|nr:4Fe-4S dicluster domain-containing protein [Alphaproteobacteria bacterium]
MSGTDRTGGSRLASFGSFVPAIDSTTCLLARAAFATCRACADACPTGALTAGPDALTIEASRCLGCGLCVPACPEAAIASPLRFDLTIRGSKALFLACAASAVHDGDRAHAVAGAIPCLHMLGLRDLAAIHNQGAELVVACCGDCSSCLELRGPRLADTASLFATLLGARGITALRFEFVDQERFLQLRQQALPPGDTRVLARRAFLRMFSPPAMAKAEAGRDAFGIVLTAPDNVTAFRPSIDGRKCSGCDACIHACPHGALRLEHRDPGGEPTRAYAITPSACTNCGLCRDICTENAITIAKAGRPQQFEIPLVAVRCEQCGVPGHIPAMQPPQPRCRVCARLDGRQRLFQVQD